jgi:hypothetical protein
MTTLSFVSLLPSLAHLVPEPMPQASLWDKPVAKRFPVMIKPIGGSWNQFMIGHVVTHLDLQTWCDWKGYKLITLHAGMRDARPGEKTDLF